MLNFLKKKPKDKPIHHPTTGAGETTSPVDQESIKDLREKMESLKLALGDWQRFDTLATAANNLVVLTRVQEKHTGDEQKRLFRKYIAQFKADFAQFQKSAKDEKANTSEVDEICMLVNQRANAL